MKKIFLPMIIIAGLCCLAFSDQTASYSLQDCYQMAISRSEALADQQEQVLQAEEHYKQTLGALLPSLTGLASYTIQPNASDQTLVKATASYPLFRGFRMVGAIKQNESLLLAQKEAKKWAALQLYADVSQAVFLYGYLLQDQQLLVEQQSLLTQRLKEIQGRVNIGRSRRTEVYSMQISIIQLQTLLIQSQSQLASAESLLQFLTGQESKFTLDIDTANNILQTLPNYLGRISQRPDIIVAKHRLDSGVAAEKIAKDGESTPQVDLNGNLYLTRPAPNQSTAWDAQIQMTLPNFLGDVSQSKTREAESVRKQAELSLSLIERKAKEDISSTYTNLVAEKTQIQLLDDALDVSAKSLDAVASDYRMGLSNNLDVLQAMNAHIDMKRSLNKMRFAYKTDEAKLLSLTADIPDGAGTP